MPGLAFFVGGHVAPNVLLDLANLGWILGDSFALHAVVDERADVRPHLDPFVLHRFDCSTKRAEARALHAYLGDNDPDVVVQVSEPTQHGWLVGLLARYHDTPFVFRYGTDAYYSYVPRQGFEKVEYYGLHNVLGRWPPRLADRAIALGPLGKQRLLERGVDPSSVGILPPALDPDRLHDPVEPDDGVPVPPREHVAVFVGRLNRLKGMDFLVDALPALVRRRDDIGFLVVGPGEEPSLPPGVDDAVTFTGYVPPESVGAYLAAGDVLVIPSLREGFPRVLLEGVEVGLTPIARPVGETPTVTDNLFTDRREFLDLLCEFESLPVPSVRRFRRSELVDRYVGFFERFRRSGSG